MRFLVNWYCGNADHVTFIEADGPYGLADRLQAFMDGNEDNQPEDYGGEVQIGFVLEWPTPMFDMGGVPPYIAEHDNETPILLLGGIDDESAIEFLDLRTIQEAPAGGGHSV